MSCAEYSERRRKCHSVYGKFGEECLGDELQEKRCLSLVHCHEKAKKYYGPEIQGLPKGLCASWAESFAFAGKELEFGDDFVENHVRAQHQVNENPRLKAECREIARDLARCLQSANVSRHL